MSELTQNNGAQVEETSAPAAEEATKKQERVYTQSQLDDIISKREATLYKNYAKNNVPKSDYDELSSKYNELNHQVKGEAIKKVFLENGGKEGSFEDFLQVNNMLYELEPKELPKAMSQIKTMKEHFFNNSPNPNELKIMKSLVSSEEDIQPGLIFYKGK